MRAPPIYTCHAYTARPAATAVILNYSKRERLIIVAKSIACIYRGNKTCNNEIKQDVVPRITTYISYYIYNMHAYIFMLFLKYTSVSR